MEKFTTLEGGRCAAQDDQFEIHMIIPNSTFNTIKRNRAWQGPVRGNAIVATRQRKPRLRPPTEPPIAKARFSSPPDISVRFPRASTRRGTDGLRPPLR